MTTPPRKQTRRRLIKGALAAAAIGPQAGVLQAAETATKGATPTAAKKVLRVAFNAAESNFDPARISDIYSRTVTSHIFEALYSYDHLARPSLIVPLTAEALPEVSADFRVFTVRLRRGIFYADDPAFKGQPRELVARDYVYAFQRTVDPANISPIESTTLDLKLRGLAAAREAAVQSKKPFDYDRAVEGLEVVDRYTLRFKLEDPRPRFIETLAQSDLLGGVAREVVEFYGDKIGEHPVGTGPFRLKQWRRSSRIVLERNPSFREVLYTGQPAADDAEGQALLARFKGRRIPMVDEVEIAVIDEDQPRWLTFLGGQIDSLAGQYGSLPTQFVMDAIPGGKLAPRLQRAEVRQYTALSADCTVTYFNMLDPMIGGYEPAQVALRRAISLAYDVQQEIRLIRRGQAQVAQSMLLPHTTGYDPAFKSEMGDYDPPRARALLDLYGFVDRNGDGWRERPDGSPLLLDLATEPDQIYRLYNELWQKFMKAIGVRVKFSTQQWPENLKSADAGKLMIWTLGSSAQAPDGQDALARAYSPMWGAVNFARFKLDAFDRIYEKMIVLPDGPERLALFHEAKRLTVAYMPYKVTVNRMATDLTHPWLTGFRRPQFWNEWWHLVDIDTDLRSKSQRT
jgi:ABC-type transport system substrate-binding protein